MLGNLLLRWIYRPGSDLCVVYNDSRMIGAGGEEIQNRTRMREATFFWRKWSSYMNTQCVDSL